MTQIKSQKTKAYLTKIHGSLCSTPKYDKERVINPYTCKQAIIRAEQEARERAVKALAKTCEFSVENKRGLCCARLIIDEHGSNSKYDLCQQNCDAINNFLKHYDNEE